MKILVTGGAGYIGSFAVRQLLRDGFEVTVFDVLENGHSQALPAGIELIRGDLRLSEEIEAVFSGRSFDAVIHFAGYIESGESMKDPLKFFENNFSAGVNLLSALNRHAVGKFIFSSTAGVYGNGNPPYREESPIDLTSYYSLSKYFFEEALRAWVYAYRRQAVVLRYFNAAGAASDGSLGESHWPETHLIPNVIKAALGQTDRVRVFGADWETPDGTGVRDYIHVEDLAAAHVAALGKFSEPGFKFSVYNVGIGRGFSVREIIDEVRAVSKSDFKVEYLPRRPGDWATSFADSSKIKKELCWEPRFDLPGIVSSAYLWHKNHPLGFIDA